MRDVILFDLDGTLLDTHDAILESMRYATYQVLRKQIPDDVLLAEVGQPLAVQMRTLAPDEDTAEELIRVYRSRTDQDLEQKTAPFPGIIDLIKALKRQGYTVAVVTSKREVLANKSLRLFGMLDLFARVNGMEASAGHKPDPDPLIQISYDLSVSLDRCLYVGDSPYDIQAAHRAHIPCIGVTWGGFFDKDTLQAEHPSALVDSCEDLFKMIDVMVSSGR